MWPSLDLKRGWRYLVHPIGSTQLLRGVPCWTYVEIPSIPMEVETYVRNSPTLQKTDDLYQHVVKLKTSRCRYVVRSKSSTLAVWNSAAMRSQCWDRRDQFCNFAQKPVVIWGEITPISRACRGYKPPSKVRFLSDFFAEKFLLQRMDGNPFGKLLGWLPWESKDLTLLLV